MPRYFTPGNNSLSQSNIDTNNVCPCANDINTKVINSSNSSTLQNYTQIEKRVNLIKYSLGGKIMFGNYNPYTDKKVIADAIAMAAVLDASTSTNTSLNQRTTASATSDNSLTNNLPSDLYLRCSVPPRQKCVRPIKNKF